MSLTCPSERSGFDANAANQIRRARLFAASLACGLIAASVLAAGAQAPQQNDQIPQQNLVPPQQQSPQGGQAPQEPGAVPELAPEAELPPANGPSPSFRPGFLETLGRWLGDSKAAIDSRLRSTQDTLGDTLGTLGKTWGDQAKDAASGMVAIPGTRVVTGRQLCPAASNGAPDCQQGVDNLCRSKGFQGGRSLDVTSAQRCPAKVWMSGRPPKDGECRLDTYVTRAVCQ